MIGKAIGVLVIAWFSTGLVWGWTGGEGGMRFILPISLVIGGISAVIFGMSLTVSAHIMLSARHKVDVRLPKEMITLHSILGVSQYYLPSNLELIKLIVKTKTHIFFLLNRI